MSRLPSVGGDNNTWGNILNDFLKVEHNTDGSLKNVARPSDVASAQAAATAAARSSTGDLVLQADSNANGTGDLVFKVRGTEYLRIANDGTVTGFAATAHKLTSPTYGQATSFGNVAGSFTFGGSGTPADIYAPLVIYQRYGYENPNANIEKTTQAWFSAAAYYGPTVDDSAEAGSSYVGIKDTGTPFTQTRAVTAFEGQASAEGGNSVTGQFIGTAGRLKFKDTSSVTTGIGVYSTYEKDAGATVGTYYAFKQSTAGPATTNYGLYANDRILSEQGLRVGRSANSGIFDVDWSFGHGDAFIYAQLPDGTNKVLVRLQAITGQTQHLQGWFDSGSNERAFVTATGFHITNGTGYIAQLSGVNQMQLASDGLRWMAAGLEQTTVGAAGGATALPASPTKYLKVKDSTGATLVIPAFAVS